MKNIYFALFAAFGARVQELSVFEELSVTTREIAYAIRVPTL